MNLTEKKIRELVSENYVFASILYYFGIRFFEYSEETLEEVCKRNNIDAQRIVRELDKSARQNPEELALSKYPVDLLIEYLKHSHHIFAKKKIPYLASLIQDLKPEGSEKAIIEDLKIIFPLFVEDFIHHMYLEEDHFFTYVYQLMKADQGKVNPSKLFFLMEKHSVIEFASEHEAEDDTMEGIRKITNDFYTDEKTPLHLKVIYDELISFEKALDNHAHIENDILFPKALAIENRLKEYFNKSTRLN